MIYLSSFKVSEHRVNNPKWFFGHYHENKIISDKEILVYEQLIRIS